jgi:hypothetical protein
MRKPSIKSEWRGQKGNKWRAYNVRVNGQVYHHQSKSAAMRQYKAAMRVYKKKKN